MSRRRPDRRAGGPAPAKKERPPARSWLWVEADGPGGKRIEPHEVTLALDIDPEGGGTLDLFVERGGREFSGLTVQALRVPGLRRVEDLEGGEIVEPPPPLLGIGPPGAPLASCGGTGAARAAANPLRKLGRAPEGPAPPLDAEAAPEDEAEIDMEAEEAAPDDDAALGDLETYRRRRAEEGKLDVGAEEPALDEAAIEEAEAAAAAERALVLPDQAYEVESICLLFGKIGRERGGERTIAIDVEGRCAAIDDRGEVERAGIPFGGHLVARLEA